MKLAAELFPKEIPENQGAVSNVHEKNLVYG